MKSRIGIALAVVVAIGLVGFTGGAVAHPNAGVSGNCDNSDGGGSGSVQVSDSPDAVDPAEVQSIVDGLALFGQNFTANPQGNNGCDGRDPGDSTEDNDDYIEAHASGSGQGVQVCYSDGNDESSPSQENVNTGHADNEHCS